ncbi:hypothetical protein L3X38_008398 [Prunus dulcis]|uniref:Uncharacterized protein n=1 Tax=Prunus dulcis TaxID=3755 RepID=A0AAD5F732_PRUDU|nr:hypothetical protein L3X38_008398 [Prunus dulcis]
MAEVAEVAAAATAAVPTPSVKKSMLPVDVDPEVESAVDLLKEMYNEVVAAAILKSLEACDAVAFIESPTAPVAAIYVRNLAIVDLLHRPRPPAADNQEADNLSQAITRRLPREIKAKLAKVARLAFRTLKRNFKIKAPSLESKALQQQSRASDDFQEIASGAKELSQRKLSMDAALEDKICDLYDLFVDGLDEDAGPQIRKLYAELAGLWPNGFMDNHGIKRAISSEPAPTSAALTWDYIKLFPDSDASDNEKTDSSSSHWIEPEVVSDHNKLVAAGTRNTTIDVH